MYKFDRHECAVAIQYGPFDEEPFKVIDLPCYAQEVSNSVSSSWSEQTVIGRTGALEAYTGTTDVNSSFSFDLHRDMQLPGSSSEIYGDKIDELISLIKSACYPRYSNNRLQPPRVTWKFGDMYISGRLKEVTDVWKPPIIHRAYAVCTLSVQMTSAVRKIVDHREVARVADSGNARNARSHVFGDEYTFD